MLCYDRQKYLKTIKNSYTEKLTILLYRTANCRWLAVWWCVIQSWVLSFNMYSQEISIVGSLKLSFHMIAHDRRIAEHTASDRQRLYGNTFQRSSAIFGNTFQRSGDRRSWATLRFSDSSDPALESDHMETKLNFAKLFVENSFSC